MSGVKWRSRGENVHITSGIILNNGAIPVSSGLELAGDWYATDHPACNGTLGPNTRSAKSPRRRRCDGGALEKTGMHGDDLAGSVTVVPRESSE